jgi:S1-C subfamily serine protease
MRATFTRKIAVLFGGLLLVAFGFVLGTSVINTSASPVSAPALQQSTARLPITEDEKYFSDIYNRVGQSVVSISVVGSSDQFGVFAASGTGFVIDQQGHIVTNNHVVDNADQIEVNFLDGTIVEGTVVGLDPDSDLAVLKVDLPAEKLIPVAFGDSDGLFIGETTIAIGSPFGQRWTLTTGIISALGRTIQGLNTNFSVGSVIQTDAAINPGNSGGPLLNLNGEVIGVNSQIASESRANAGVGFAIPSNLVKRVAGDLIANGKVHYSFLDMSSGVDMSLSLIQALSLPNNLRGVIVSDVNPQGPAGQAGLLAPSSTRVINGERVPTSADIITAIDGQPVTGMSSLVSYLASKTTPGQVVNLTVWRDGQQLNIPVTLGERP